MSFDIDTKKRVSELISDFKAGRVEGTGSAPNTPVTQKSGGTAETSGYTTVDKKFAKITDSERQPGLKSILTFKSGKAISPKEAAMTALKVGDVNSKEADALMATVYKQIFG